MCTLASARKNSLAPYLTQDEESEYEDAEDKDDEDLSVAAKAARVEERAATRLREEANRRARRDATDEMIRYLVSYVKVRTKVEERLWRYKRKLKRKSGL